MVIYLQNSLVCVGYILSSLCIYTHVGFEWECSESSEIEGTAEFVDIFDKYFDIFYVSNFYNGKRERKRFQEPYRDASDFRLKVNSY